MPYFCKEVNNFVYISRKAYSITRTDIKEFPTYQLPQRDRGSNLFSNHGSDHDRSVLFFSSS